MTNKEWLNARKIIKAAKKIGVKRLKLGTLEFELAESAPRPASKVPKKKLAAIEERAKSQVEFNEAQDEISIMHVEDPALFERALLERELHTDDEAQFEEAHVSEAERDVSGESAV